MGRELGAGKMKIGLTGGIASGKSTAARLLVEMGIKVIDADKVGHSVIEKGGTRRWIEENCPEAVTEAGIDRRVLGSMIFSDADALKEYNAIVHPELCAEIEELMGEEKGSVVVEAAVLIEAGWQNIVDEVWLVTANTETRIVRLMSRNGYTREEALMRISSQMSDEEKAAYADVVIDNSGSEAELEERIRKILKERNL